MNVLLIESDDAVRDSLVLILEDAGHIVAHASSVPDGIAYLRACDHPVTTIMSNQAPDNHVLVDFFEQILADPTLVARHRYVAMTTAPARMPPQTLAALHAICAPIVRKPFNLDDLLSALGQ
ncbi:MAG TPA: hypothetical protein VF812_04090 [Ktedonobacterales bacterium]